MDNNTESANKPPVSKDELASAMNKLAQYRSSIPVAFILVIIFFFFGFCSFKCNGTKVASVKGINLVTGTHLKTDMGQMLHNNPFNPMNEGSENPGNAKGQKVPASFWAIVAFLSAIAGFVVFYKKAKREALLGTLLGVLGFISLFILRLVIKSKVESQGGGMIHIEAGFLFGYWASLLAFLVAGGISYLRLKQKEKVTPVTGQQPVDTQGPAPIQVNIITREDDTIS